MTLSDFVKSIEGYDRRLIFGVEMNPKYYPKLLANGLLAAYIKYDFVLGYIIKWNTTIDGVRPICYEDMQINGK